MVFVACIPLLCLLLACAIWDARRYRIPDLLTASLFWAALLATRLPGWPVDLDAALGGFLFAYPVLFLLWSGRPLAIPEPIEINTVSPGRGERLAAYCRFILSTILVPSPVAWLVMLGAGIVWVNATLWMALPVGLLFCCLTALKVSPSMPWHRHALSSSWLGGGDLKMLCASMTLLGSAALQQFSLLLALSNVALIICLKWMRRDARPDTWQSRRVPMGVAIALSCASLLVANVALAM